MKLSLARQANTKMTDLDGSLLFALSGCVWARQNISEHQFSLFAVMIHFHLIFVHQLPALHQLGRDVSVNKSIVS